MPRKHVRKDFRVECVLESTSRKHGARIQDISLGGCYIDTLLPVTVGAELRFDIIHPNGGRLPFAGVVTHHSNSLGFGVRFTNLNNEQEMFLKRILRT